MNQITNIDLTAATEISPEPTDTQTVGWWRDGNVITIRNVSGVTTYRLPRGRPVVSMIRLGNGKARLGIGGFTKTTLFVTGPTAVIEAIRAEVL